MKYRVRIKNPIIGVPITFLDKFDPEQFEILGDSRFHDGSNESNDINYINGKLTYRRLLVRWIPEVMPTIDEDGVILYASEKEN